MTATRITSMLRNTAQTYRVKLECGHIAIVSKDELARNQWYIGRRVPCTDCDRTHTNEG